MRRKLVVLVATVSAAVTLGFATTHPLRPGAEHLRSTEIGPSVIHP